MFGIIREFLQVRKYTGIINMKTLLRNSPSSGVTKELIFVRILTNIMNLVNILSNSSIDHTSENAY